VAGVSGLGPALAVIASATDLERVMGGLPQTGAVRKVVPFTVAAGERGPS
jgi:hypothetical protein